MYGLSLGAAVAVKTVVASKGKTRWESFDGFEAKYVAAVEPPRFREHTRPSNRKRVHKHPGHGDRTRPTPEAFTSFLSTIWRGL